MKEKILSYILKLDIYGTHPRFTINGEKKFNTYFGSFMTLVSASIILLFFFMYTQEIINHKNPKLITTVYSDAHAAERTITSKDFCNSSRVKNHLANLNITSSNLNNSSGGRFGYCVYEVSAGTTGSYYVTVTFINFNIPVVGSNLVFPVYGQTKIVGKDYNY